MEENKKKRLAQIDLRPLWTRVSAALEAALEAETLKDVYVKFTKREKPRVDEVIQRLKEAGYDVSWDSWSIRLRFFQAEEPENAANINPITINENGEAE